MEKSGRRDEKIVDVTDNGDVGHNIDRGYIIKNRQDKQDNRQQQGRLFFMIRDVHDDG